MQKYDFTETDRKYSYHGFLGADYSPVGTEFSVWSPYAESITLRLYESCTADSPVKQIAMKMDADGVWRCTATGDLDGIYYAYLVAHSGKECETPDIYARSAGINGKRGMIFSPQSVDIKGWDIDRPVKLRSPADAVIYELHIRDLSMDENADFKHRGKFTAMCEEGVKNSHRDSVGLDYISQLGVTHVHLLPVMDYQSVDEKEPSFNWGYDPYLYNVPEGSYSSDPYDGRCRVRELKMLVQALHKRGIGVILDVVYNHTYTVEDSPFSNIFPHYYYRHDKKGYSNGSGCGNELATEREMARKFICDSLCTLARDYHLDGFRFDLMGLIDTKTLVLCEKKLRKINPDILLYGEGWTGGISPLHDECRALKHNVEKLSGIAMFSDDFRDGVKGSVFSDNDCGYVNGVTSDERRELIKSVLCGGVFHHGIDRPEWQCWAKTPLHSVNYVEAHDNLTFYDKLCISMENSTTEERIRADKLGAALVFLAQGIPFIQAGQELLRSKDLDHNSYRSPDSVNCIKWNSVTENREVMEYYKGLIAIRKTYPEFRMTSAEDIKKIRFDDLFGGGFVMHYDKISLAVNPSEEQTEYSVDGSVFVLADGDRACAEPFRTISGTITIPPKSILLYTQG